jgi:serine/threonine-protein kinase RsbW
MINKIKIPCNTEKLKEVRNFVNATLSKLALPETEVNMLVLAVDEICANRIIHSNKCNSDKDLEIEIIDYNEGIKFKITDSGDYYDVANHKDPDIMQLIKERKKGGIGLFLVKKIMDSIEVKREDPFTTHTLIKKLKISQS